MAGRKTKAERIQDILNLKDKGHIVMYGNREVKEYTPSGLARFKDGYNLKLKLPNLSIVKKAKEGTMKVFIGMCADGHFEMGLSKETWQPIKYQDGYKTFEFKNSPRVLLTGTGGCCSNIEPDRIKRITEGMKPGEVKGFELTAIK